MPAAAPSPAPAPASPASRAATPPPPAGINRRGSKDRQIAVIFPRLTAKP